MAATATVMVSRKRFILFFGIGPESGKPASDWQCRNVRKIEETVWICERLFTRHPARDEVDSAPVL